MVAGSKRQKKKTNRRPPNKSEKERILILCEDKVSVPKYLEKLIQELGLSPRRIVICGKGADPSDLVKQGQEKLEKDDDFDSLYFVFDRDTHEHYGDAICDMNNMSKEYKKIEIKIDIITSLPCFEFWLMLHLTDSAKPYSQNKSSGMKSPCESLQDSLKKLKNEHGKEIFKEYKKTNVSEYYEELKKLRNTAIQNAEKIIANSQDLKYFENPHTRMHILVKKLDSLSE